MKTDTKQLIDTDKYEGHTPAPWMMSEYKGRPSISAHAHTEKPTWVRSIARKLNGRTADHALLLDAPLLLAEVKRLQKENKILAKYMEIVQKYDDALLADGDTDPRWSELYD